MSWFYTCVPKSQSYNVFLEIWSATDIIFCHFGPFLPFYPTNDPKDITFSKDIISSFSTCVPYERSYDVWFLRYKALQSFLSFWAIFCPLTLLTTQKTNILKKVWRYYHFTFVYHKWHMVYAFWDIECDRQFLVILGQFFASLSY